MGAQVTCCSWAIDVALRLHPHDNIMPLCNVTLAPNVLTITCVCTTLYYAEYMQVYTCDGVLSLYIDNYKLFKN